MAKKAKPTLPDGSKNAFFGSTQTDDAALFAEIRSFHEQLELEVEAVLYKIAARLAAFKKGCVLAGLF